MIKLIENCCLTSQDYIRNALALIFEFLFENTGLYWISKSMNHIILICALININHIILICACSRTPLTGVVVASEISEMGRPLRSLILPGDVRDSLFVWVRGVTEHSGTFTQLHQLLLQQRIWVLRNYSPHSHLNADSLWQRQVSSLNHFLG